MKCLFFAFGLSLCTATASAAPVSYNFIFERPNGALILEPVDGGSREPYSARVSDHTSYEPLFELWLSHDGPLDGLTFDLATLEVSGFIDFWSTPVGFLTFGSGTEVAAWDAYDDSIESGGAYAFAWHHTSAANPVDPWYVENTVNPEIIPAVHYGMNYTEPASHMFQLLPGRWSCFVDGVSCDAVVSAAPAPTHAPVPASLPLLLGGLAVLGWIGRRRIS